MHDMNSCWGGQPYQSQWAKVICGGSCKMFIKNDISARERQHFDPGEEPLTRCPQDVTNQSGGNDGRRKKRFHIFSSECFDVFVRSVFEILRQSPHRAGGRGVKRDGRRVRT